MLTLSRRGEFPASAAFHSARRHDCAMAAIYLAWRRTVKLGAALFSFAMAASLAFGLTLHFAIDGPDLHSNVALEHGTVFLYSALGLAAVEFVGFVVGVQIWFRGRNSGDDRPPTNVTLPFRARSGGATHEAVQWNTGAGRTTVPLRRSRPLALSEFISAPGTAGGFAPKPARRKVNLPGTWGVREKDFSYEVLRVSRVAGR